MRPAPIFTAPRNDIVVDEVVDELLIYDRRADVAHCLSEVAALVWRTCEGGATLDGIAEQIVAHDLAGSSDDATELAQSAVSELVEKGLLEASGVRAGLVSRRQALRRMAGVGAAAVVAPLVVSAAVPKSALAHGSPPTCITHGSGGCSPHSSIYSSNNCCTANDYCSSNGHCDTCITSTNFCSGSYECCPGLTCSGSPVPTCH